VIEGTTVAALHASSYQRLLTYARINISNRAKGLIVLVLAGYLATMQLTVAGSWITHAAPTPAGTVHAIRHAITGQRGSCMEYHAKRKAHIE
jgi:hypothetical protein